MTTVDDLLETFDLLGDEWEERFQYVIDLGKDLPEMPAADKVEKNKVQGCQSQVWMTARASAEQPPRLEISADADAFIVKGLVAILLVLYSGKTADEILNLDIESLFQKLGLDRNLTPTRSNGLHAMVRRIQAYARQLKETGTL